MNNTNTESGGITVIPCEDIQGWKQVLEECHCFDFYHLPSYHLMAQRRGEGSGILLVYREGAKVAAMPLLIRSLQGVPGLENCSAEWYDATSVYGYPGPITDADPADVEFLRCFNLALMESLSELKIISAFSRLHPLLQNHNLLPCAGQISHIGWTVSIDLTLPLETQRAKYRKDHKYGINKAKQAGVIAYHDAEWKQYDDFLQLYAMTMERVDADDASYFDRAYFDQLRQSLGPNLHLFVAELDGVVISAGLFSLFQNIVQFHLSGSDTEYLRYAPSKVLLDEVRLWALSQGAKVFHLGGGVGASKDGVFMFKAGFSDRRHRFMVWRCVVVREVYDHLVRRKTEWEDRKHLIPILPDYFPFYRRPVALEESSSIVLGVCM